MRYLKDEVLGASSTVQLASDAEQLMKEFQTATGKRVFVGSNVHFWAPRTGNCSLRVLRAFFTPAEGGVDQQLDPRKPWISRRRRMVKSMVPWEQMPVSVTSLPGDVDPGARLQDGFALAFVDLCLNPQMPREKMLRGHIQEATAGLVNRRDQLQRLRTWLDGEKDPQATLARWVEEARKAQADLLIAEEKARREKSPDALAAVKAAQVRVEDVWQKDRSEIPLRIFECAGVPALKSETAYLLALCKHEQAEQAQTALERRWRREQASEKDQEETAAAWSDAARRWQEYLDDPGSSRDEAAARLLLARALEKKGDRAGAREILAKPPARTSPWEKITFRMRLQQLEASDKR
jgi:hypothetical protein